MLTFKQFTESWQPEKAIRGWMSPSGEPHLFPQYHEHKDNHHPDYLEKHGGKQGDSVQHAQAKGFVRFGGNVSSIHGFHHFVHYDAKHPKGKATALKALQYMKPEHNDEVTLSGSAGVYKTSKATGMKYKNARAMKELGHEGIMPASQAYRKLQQEGLDKLNRAMKSSAAYKILDSHPSTKGSTWQAGGCGVLAHALHKHLPGSKMVDVHNKTTGNTEHVAVHHGNFVYDANGATRHKGYLDKFRKRENIPAHHELELTDHDPKRAAKSEISTHPSLIDATHAHLSKTLSD